MIVKNNELLNLGHGICRGGGGYKKVAVLALEQRCCH